MDERHLGRERKFHHLPHPIGYQRSVSSESNPPKIWKLKFARTLVVNIITNKVARLLGKDETVRWMNLAMYQGRPAKKSLNTVVSTIE